MPPEVQPTQSDCLHEGPRPLIWHHHDAGEGLDYCRCQDCGALVAMEPPEPDDLVSDLEALNEAAKRVPQGVDVLAEMYRNALYRGR